MVGKNGVQRPDSRSFASRINHFFPSFDTSYSSPFHLLATIAVVSFKEIPRIVADNWRAIDPSTNSFDEGVATALKERYASLPLKSKLLRNNKAVRGGKGGDGDCDCDCDGDGDGSGNGNSGNNGDVSRGKDLFVNKNADDDKLELLELDYIQRVYHNRGDDTTQRRVWVQGRFRKHALQATETGCTGDEKHVASSSINESSDILKCFLDSSVKRWDDH